MKKYILTTALLLCLITGVQTANAQDGFFSEGRTLDKGTAAIDLQPVILTAQDDFLMIFRGSYGFTNRLTGHAKVGALQEDVYLGGHFEYNLVSESYDSNPFSAALIAGVYNQGETGLKFGLDISKFIDPIGIYTGLNYQPFFVNDEVTLHSFLLPVGIGYHFDQSPVDFVLEADIPLNDDAEYLEAVTFGARIYLN